MSTCRGREHIVTASAQFADNISIIVMSVDGQTNQIAVAVACKHTLFFITLKLCSYSENSHERAKENNML